MDQYIETKKNPNWKSLTKSGMPSDRSGMLAEFAKGAIQKKDLVSYNITLEEHGLYRRKNKIIFLESPNLIDSLLRSSFSLAKGGKVTMPFDSFTIAIPKGYRYNNTLIPPALVTYASADERIKLYGQDWLARNNINVTIPSNVDIHEKSLSVIFNSTTIGKYRFHIDEQLIPSILKSKSAEEMSERIGQDMWMVEEDDITQQFVLAKLIVSMGIYESAAHSLKKGLPRNVIIPPVTDKTTPYTPLTITDKFKRDSTLKTAHVCRAHFNNLVHPRYYQGKYKDMEPGSRWASVKAHLRGIQTDEIYTQEDEKVKILESSES